MSIHISFGGDCVCGGEMLIVQCQDQEDHRNNQIQPKY